MTAYRCAHCGTLLPDQDSKCPYHPDGIVEAFDDGDPQPE